jgi:hypothetical protein
MKRSGWERLASLNAGLSEGSLVELFFDGFPRKKRNVGVVVRFGRESEPFIEVMLGGNVCRVHPRHIRLLEEGE